MRRAGALALVPIGLLGVACTSAAKTPPPAAEDGRPSLLPDRAGPFRAVGPLVAGDGFRRRTYAMGKQSVEVTIARMPTGPDAYQNWVLGSQGYAALGLPVSPALASGFFTCADDTGSVCDAHIQFRSGFHVEAMGNGRVGKADLARLLASLSLARLTDPAALPM